MSSLAARAAHVAALAEIERVIAENAALLGERPMLGIRLLSHGRVSIVEVRDGRKVRGTDVRTYANIDRALAAAREANARAKLVAVKRAEGMTTQQAIADSYREAPPWTLVP